MRVSRAARDDAGDVVVPMLQPRRRRALLPQRQRHECATQRPDRPGREGRDQSITGTVSSPFRRARTVQKVAGTMSTARCRQHESLKVGDGAQAVDQHGKAAREGEQRDEHVGEAPPPSLAHPGSAEASSGAMARSTSVIAASSHVALRPPTEPARPFAAVGTAPRRARRRGRSSRMSVRSARRRRGCQRSIRPMRPTSRDISEAVSANLRSMSSG